MSKQPRKSTATKGYLGHLTSTEETTLTEFRTSFAKYEWKDEQLLRFLRARGFNLVKSTKMLEEYMKWYEEVRPHEIKYSAVKNHARTGKFYLYKHDKLGHPCVYMTPRMHNPKIGVEEAVLHVAYTMEAVSKAIGKSNMDKCVCIYDGKGVGMSNWDRKFSSGALKIVQNYYPEFLTTLYLVDAPPVVRTLWKIVKQWVDPETQKKIQFLGKDYAAVLKTHFDEDCLPERFGGCGKGLPRDVPPPPGQKRRSTRASAEESEPEPEEEAEPEPEPEPKAHSRSISQVDQELGSAERAEAAAGKGGCMPCFGH